jgi:hypothetical protein
VTVTRPPRDFFLNRIDEHERRLRALESALRLTATAGVDYREGAAEESEQAEEPENE